MPPHDYYPTGTQYGSHTPGRPFIARLDDGIYLKVPKAADKLTADGAATVRLDPDIARELIVAAIMALQDEAYDDECEGYNSSATLAAKYLREIGIPKL